MEIASVIISIASLVGVILIGYKQVQLSAEQVKLSAEQVKLSAEQVKVSDIANKLAEDNRNVEIESHKREIISKHIDLSKILSSLGEAFAYYSMNDLKSIRNLYDVTMEEKYVGERFIDKLFAVAGAFEVVLIEFKENSFNTDIISKLYRDTIINTYNLMKVDFSEKIVDLLASPKNYGIKAKSLLDFVIKKNIRDKEDGLVEFIAFADNLIKAK
jgi:hypothetical protein